MIELGYPGSLHNHSDSGSNIKFRDTINTVESLIDYAIELGHETVAFTEHDCVSNAVKIEKYYDKIKKEHPNFKVIRGNEIYLCRNELSKENFRSGIDKYYHFILLAKNAEGHKQIRELSTRAWMRSFETNRTRRTPTYYSDLEEIIGENRGNLIASTACLGGALATQLLKYKETKDEGIYQQIINWCKYLQNIFGKDDFYFEMQPSATKEQIYVNEQILILSEKLDIPYIITCDAHYLKKEDAPIHEAYLKSQDAEREVASFYETTYLMDTEELESFMLTHLTREQIQKAYESIIEIKNKCEDYSIRKPLKIPLLKWKIPKLTVIDDIWIRRIPNLKKFIESDFVGDRVLANAIVERVAKDATLQNQEAYDEINSELDSTWVSSEVNKTHWSAYYLNLQNIIDCCWEAGSIVGPGRGSGVGFLLLYILDITQINPLRETTKTFAWRFLNPSRVSVLDVDFDISGQKRAQVLRKFREVYGEDRVSNVATFGTEKSKSAIMTAARGLGIDSDIAKYLSSLVPSDRGQIRTLKQCFYGDEENGFKPVSQFVHEMTYNYPELWEIAQRIEGLICRVGIHAGGVVFVDEDFTESAALMRAPDDTIITQFELHDSEDVGLIKYDALSVEAIDRIQTCLELLCEHGYIERENTLKETYESILGIYNLEREAPDMWKMVWDHKILSLFQMEKQSGINGIALTHPQSVDDLAVLNSVIRLMASEKGAEQPLEKFARFKGDINNWYKEMNSYGLSIEEQKILEPVIKGSYGICESQEKFMQLVQIPECGGFDLNWADRLRKSIAKKNPKEYLILEKEYFEGVEAKGLSKPLCNYVWRVLVATSRGYGFNASHTLAYSLMGLQEMNLAYRFPIIFWNCANLIVDSGGDAEIEDGGTDYGKMANAINKTKAEANIEVSLVNINKSDLTFTPDVDNNRILFGMKGLNRVSQTVTQTIIANRPYLSFKDFLARCPLNKTVMISLIKSGAFDEFKEMQMEAAKLGVYVRYYVMAYYLSRVSELKTKLNLQNLNGLITRELIPDSLKFEKTVFNFNKAIKNFKVGTKYQLIDRCADFYQEYFDIDYLIFKDGNMFIEQKDWQNMYSATMDKVRDYIKTNQQTLLDNYNFLLFKDNWVKYAAGTLSAWEMESCCFYYHEHELAHVQNEKYGINDFEAKPEEPEVETWFKKSGKEIPIFNLYRIAGTVLSKNDGKSTVTLLTTTGVVTVKFTKEYYANYNKQISKLNEDGTKSIVERSWFSRGTKLIVNGYRRGEEFVAKTYARTIGHQLYRTTEVFEDGSIILVHDRASGIGEEENERCG